MARFRKVHTPPKCAGVHACFDDHFGTEHQLAGGDRYRKSRSARLRSGAMLAG